MIKLEIIEVTQPIGTFYISKMTAKDICEYTQIKERSEQNDKNVQRTASEERIREISAYTSDPDATFPTPIIISVYHDIDISFSENTMNINLDNNKYFGEIIDGQHRIKGLKNSIFITEFEMPVILMFNLTEEEKAYVFSIINSKQTKVSMSLIYDLFSLSEKRSPQKTLHEIARSFNKDEKSPYFNRLKMLGKKEKGQELASLSQGTFVKSLLNLISKKPDEDLIMIKRGEILKNYSDLPLRKYFVEDNDTVIYKILLNCFRAVANVFCEEWNNPEEFILSKTTGFGAIIKSFNELYKIGDIKNDLSEEFFIECFQKFKNNLEQKNKKLTSDDFPSNEQTQSKLSKLIIDSQ